MFGIFFLNRILLRHDVIDALCIIVDEGGQLVMEMQRREGTQGGGGYA